MHSLHLFHLGNVLDDIYVETFEQCIAICCCGVRMLQDNLSTTEQGCLTGALVPGPVRTEELTHG